MSKLDVSSLTNIVIFVVTAAIALIPAVLAAHEMVA